MFWKIIELLTRVIFARRLRHVALVGAAAKRAGEGDFEGALLDLERIEKKMHSAVRSYHALTKGRVLDRLGRENEAEKAIIQAAKLDPSNTRAHLDLAIMSGRRFQMVNARARLEKLVLEAEPEIQTEAREALVLIDGITNGSVAEEIRRKALEFSRRPMGMNGEHPGLPADLTILDSWVLSHPDEAKEFWRDLAMLVGETWIADGGQWRLNMFLERSLIVFDDGREINPFDAVRERMAGGNISFLQYIHS